MESSIKKLSSIMIEWIELKARRPEFTSWLSFMLFDLGENVSPINWLTYQELGYIAEIQVSTDEEYNKCLSNVKRIQLFLPTNFYDKQVTMTNRLPDYLVTSRVTDLGKIYMISMESYDFSPICPNVVLSSWQQI